MNTTTTECLPRHLPGFRPLVPGEQWHRTDFTHDMLPEGWRPLMLGEVAKITDCEICQLVGTHFASAKWSFTASQDTHLVRTRRPLPPPPPTFEYDGKVWNSHIPGDPCPVGREAHVMVLSAKLWPETDKACMFRWENIIGYHILDKPVNKTDKLRERVAELERQLAAEKRLTKDATIAAIDTAKQLASAHIHVAELEKVIAEANASFANISLECRKVMNERDAFQLQLANALTPRPIAEAGEVKEGFERIFFRITENGMVGLCASRWDFTTHFIDIRLPYPDLRAEYERAVAEAGGAFEAWLKAKGGGK
jgi:hypothetical protein